LTTERRCGGPNFLNRRGTPGRTAGHIAQTGFENLDECSKSITGKEVWIGSRSQNFHRPLGEMAIKIRMKHRRQGSQPSKRQIAAPRIADRAHTRIDSPDEPSLPGAKLWTRRSILSSKNSSAAACKVRQNGHPVRYLPGLLEAHGDQHTSARVPKSPTDCGRLVGSHPQQILVPFEY